MEHGSPIFSFSMCGLGSPGHRNGCSNEGISTIAFKAIKMVGMSFSWPRASNSTSEVL